MPAHHPYPPARPVSCYALFERMAAWTSLEQLRRPLGALAGGPGSFPLGRGR